MVYSVQSTVYSVSFTVYCSVYYKTEYRPGKALPTAQGKLLSPSQQYDTTPACFDTTESAQRVILLFKTNPPYR